MNDETQTDPRRRAIAICAFAQVKLEVVLPDLPEDERKVVERAMEELQRCGDRLHDFCGDPIL
jgi:hypothetical protein